MLRKSVLVFFVVFFVVSGVVFGAEEKPKKDFAKEGGLNEARWNKIIQNQDDYDWSTLTKKEIASLPENKMKSIKEEYRKQYFAKGVTKPIQKELEYYKSIYGKFNLKSFTDNKVESGLTLANGVLVLKDVVAVDFSKIPNPHITYNPSDKVVEINGEKLPKGKTVTVEVDKGKVIVKEVQKQKPPQRREPPRTKPGGGDVREKRKITVSRQKAARETAGARQGGEQTAGGDQASQTDSSFNVYTDDAIVGCDFDPACDPFFNSWHDNGKSISNNVKKGTVGFDTQEEIDVASTTSGDGEVVYTDNNENKLAFSGQKSGTFKKGIPWFLASFFGVFKKQENSEQLYIGGKGSQAPKGMTHVASYRRVDTGEKRNIFYSKV